MRSFWHRLGTPDAISWLSFVLVFASAGTGPFLSSGVDYRNRVGEFTLAVELSLATIVPILLLAKALLGKFQGRSWAPWISIVAFQVAVLVRSWVFDSVLVAWGFWPESRLLWRWWSTQATITAALLVAAYIVTAARELSAANAELESRVEQLQSIRTSVQQRVTAHREGLLESIRSQLSHSLNRLSRESTIDTSQQLQHAIDEVVRPLSLQLRLSTAIESARAHVDVPGHIRWRLVIQSALASSPNHPILLGIWISWAAFGSWVPLYGWYTAIIAIACGLVTAIVLFIADRLWSRVPQSFGTGARAILFTAVLVVSVAAAVLTAALLNVEVLRPGPIMASLWNVSTFGWGIALATGIVRAMGKLNTQLLLLEGELDREITALNAHSRKAQLAVSRLLHGPVQDAIASALRKVETGVDSSQLPDLVVGLQQTITTVLENEDFSVQPVSFRSALADIAELWLGLCEVSVRAQDAVLSRVESDPTATSALIELAREACSNAIRHGNAHACVVEVALTNDGRSVELIVTNNGDALSADSVDGYGSQLFSELSTSWARVATTDGTRVSAIIPFG